MKYGFILIGLLLINCSSKSNEDKLFTGDLYFSPVRYGSFYGLEDSVQRAMLSIMDTINIEAADKSSLEFITNYKKLEENGMLCKPYVDLMTGENQFVKLYLDSSDYNKIKKYNRNYLQYTQQKVVIKARTREIGFLNLPLLYCDSLAEVKLVKGETLMRGNKFRIVDYE